jgi:DNA-binding response OmpR family regulator
MTSAALIAHRPRLLVVDDEPNIAELLRIWFEPVGWDVVTASSGPEGVARVAEHTPEAVVLDMMLPGYGGLEVLRRIRLLHPRVAVVLSTARDSDEDRAAGLAAGADAYLVKPYSLVELERRLRTLLLHLRDLDDHVGRLDHRGRRLAHLEPQLVGGVAAHQRHDAVVATGELDLGHDAVALDCHHDAGEPVAGARRR